MDALNLIRQSHVRLLIGLVLAGALVLPVHAHVVLQEPVAPAGSSYRAVFRVSHGCDGQPTTGLRVFIPDGVRGAKPMPKPGWTLSTRRAVVAQPYDSHGKTVREDVVEIVWQAQGPEHALPDDWYDEFTVLLRLPAQPGALWFRVLQSCADRMLDWSEVPAQGVSTGGLKHPAALLQVQPAPVAHAH
jgi:uncharacterized protein YcnI